MRFGRWTVLALVLVGCGGGGSDAVDHQASSGAHTYLVNGATGRAIKDEPASGEDVLCEFKVDGAVLTCEVRGGVFYSCHKSEATAVCQARNAAGNLLCTDTLDLIGSESSFGCESVLRVGADPPGDQPEADQPEADQPEKDGDGAPSGEEGAPKK